MAAGSRSGGDGHTVASPLELAERLIGAYLQIRPVRVEDARAVGALCSELGYPTTERDAATRLQALEDSKVDCLLVAEQDGDVVGWIHVVLRRFLESEPTAEFGGLVVTESCRGRGVGGQLVARGEQWARLNGASRIRVRSNVIRADAHRFYERLGYATTKTQRVLDKTL